MKYVFLLINTNSNTYLFFQEKIKEKRSILCYRGKQIERLNI